MQVCVYNQTNECFLSLGATRDNHLLAPLKRVLRIGFPRIDEGRWITPPNGLTTLGFFSHRDLVYLDRDYRVIHVVESFPTIRPTPVRQDAESLLSLPPHSICSSQTKPGNQLVICAPEEMESRLREIAGDSGPARPADPARASRRKLPPGVTQERRRADRTAAKCPVSYFSAGGAPAAHVIRDISETGLYLLTSERWPVGAEVRMSLQASDHRTGKSASPITLRMRVVRWGKDGVGLEFAGPTVDQNDLMGMHVC